jgi:hypothetical protein
MCASTPLGRTTGCCRYSGAGGVAWPEVARAYLRRYDPLGEYGGWGIKGTSQNRAYNIANEEGLQLELHNGRRLLLGTQRPTELAQALATLQLQP